MDIANLIIRVTNEGLDRATRELRRLQENASGAQEANERFGNSIADLNKLAMVGFGALTAVVGGSIKTAIDFEKAMAGVAKTVDFAADNGLANMKKGIEDLTKVIPLAFEELAEIASVGGQLGVVEGDILGFTETIAKMGVAFDISAGEAADSMAKIAGIFQIPIANIGELGDTINAVSNSMAATAGDVINFMRRVGGSSQALGIAADDAAALGGAMVALGMQPEIAGTAFNTMALELAKLDGSIQKTLDPFDALGLATKEFADLVEKDAVSAIMLVLEKANELGGKEGLTALDDAFGAQGMKIATMASGIDTVKFALDQVGIGADGVSKTLGSMQAEFESVSSTTANKLELTKNNMRLVAAAVGEAFLPAVNDLVASLIPLIEKMNAWASANPELIVQIAKVTAVVLGSIIAIAAISGAVGAALSAFQGLSAIFGVAKIAIMALSGPIGLTVIALGILVAAGALVYQNWDLIKQKATEIWGAITSYISNKINEIKNYFSTNFPAMTAIVSSSIEIIKTLFIGGFNLIKNTVTTVLGVIKAVISGDFKAIPSIIGNGLKTAVSIVSGMMTNILNVIKEAGKKLFNIGRDFIQGFINGIKSVGSGVVSAASSMVGNAIAAVKKRQDSASPSKVTTKLGGDFSQGMANGIKKGAKAVKTEAQKMAESAVKAVQDGVAGLKRELALFGNDSALAALDYDIKVGKFGGANTGELRSLTGQLEAAKAEAKAKDTLAAANKSVQDSIDGLIKQQALFGNNSSLAALMYDIEHTEKYKGVTQELKDELIAQTKAFEQLGMTAKATQAIQERFAKLKTDQEASGKAVDGVMGELQAETAIGKIQADYERRIEVIRKHEELTTGLIGSEEAKRVAIYESAQKAKELIQIQGNEKLFGELSSITKTFFGEQSAAHRAMFAVEKYFALKRILVENKVALAKAWASAAFPYNLPAVATVAAQTGLLAAAVKGFKQGGYTGNMGASQVAGVVHGQEYVFDAQSTKRIGVDNLNAMRSGKSTGGGGDVNINVNVDAKGNAQVSGDNEKMGRDMANGIKAVVLDVIRKEKRQGGML